MPRCAPAWLRHCSLVEHGTFLSYHGHTKSELPILLVLTCHQNSCMVLCFCPAWQHHLCTFTFRVCNSQQGEVRFHWVYTLWATVHNHEPCDPFWGQERREQNGDWRRWACRCTIPLFLLKVELQNCSHSKLNGPWCPSLMYTCFMQMSMFYQILQKIMRICQRQLLYRAVTLVSMLHWSPVWWMNVSVVMTVSCKPEWDNVIVLLEGQLRLANNSQLTILEWTLVMECKHQSSMQTPFCNQNSLFIWSICMVAERFMDLRTP